MRHDSVPLDARAFGFAAGTMAGILVIICSAAVAIAPEATTAFAGSIIHADLSGLARTLTWGNFFAGLLVWTVGTGIVFAAAGALYNRFSGHSAASNHPALTAQRAG